MNNIAYTCFSRFFFDRAPFFVRFPDVFFTFSTWGARALCLLFSVCNYSDGLPTDDSLPGARKQKARTKAWSPLVIADGGLIAFLSVISAITPAYR